MSERIEREYRAFVWTADSNRPGRRVAVWATDLDDAKKKLEDEYGEGTVFDLHNEDEANMPR